MILFSFLNHMNKGFCISGIILFLLIVHIIATYLLSNSKEKKYTLKNQELLVREELFNTLCTNINDVFVIYDIGKHDYEYISPNIDRVFGISGKEFSNGPLAFFEYTEPANKERLENLFLTNILTHYYETECEFRNKTTKQLRWVVIRFYPVMNNQKVSRYICCISDLTKVKQSQQILKNAFINSQKANEAKKEFLSHMSHELRTPINAIIGMAQIAENYLDDMEKVSNCLDKITSSSKNLLEIINNILDMAKIDSNKLKLTYKAFSIRESMNYICSIFKTQAELNYQNFEMVIPEIKDEYLIGDRLRLEQILVNCLSNSVKFTPAGGQIRLEVNEAERHANKVLYRFVVSDNGRGMSEDFIDRLFIPFEQEDASITRKYGGSGLGMSITKNLVSLMGGNIKVSSKLGEGTVITIDIVFETAGTSNENTLLQDNPDKKAFDFTGRRILVVEDNEINQEITCELLKYVNVTVETANDGYSALRMFTVSPCGYYDLIIMDVQMPGLNGYETAKAIRKSGHPDADTVIIIAMSADTYVDDLTLLLDSGMNYHIAKPIDLDYFYSLLSNVFT